MNNWYLLIIIGVQATLHGPYRSENELERAFGELTQPEDSVGVVLTSATPVGMYQFTGFYAEELRARYEKSNQGS